MRFFVENMSRLDSPLYIMSLLHYYTTCTWYIVDNVNFIFIRIWFFVVVHDRVHVHNQGIKLYRKGITMGMGIFGDYTLLIFFFFRVGNHNKSRWTTHTLHIYEYNVLLSEKGKYSIQNIWWPCNMRCVFLVYFFGVDINEYIFYDRKIQYYLYVLRFAE